MSVFGGPPNDPGLGIDPADLPPSVASGQPTDLGSGPQIASPTVEGLNFYGYGDSYLGLAAPGAITQRRFFERVGQRIRSPSVVNFGISGWLMEDASNYAHGSMTASPPAGANRTGTWTPAAFGGSLNGGLVLVNAIHNSSGWAGSSPAKAQAGFINALDSLLRLLRGNGSYLDSNAIFAYTGTWTGPSGGTTYSGSSNHFTSTHGDKVTITTPNFATPTECAVILNGWDTTLAGAAFTVTLDGVDITATLPVATTAAQCNQTHMNNGTSVSLAVPLGTLAAGVHTLVVTHNDTTGRYLSVSRLITTSPYPPTVVLMKANQLPAAAYSTNWGGNGSWAADQTYNGYVDTVVTRFGALSALGSYAKATLDKSIVTVDPNAAGWSTAWIASQDAQSAHPGDRGMAFYADLIMSVLSLLPYRLGQNSI